MPETSDRTSYSAVTPGNSAVIIKPKDATQKTQTTKADMLHQVKPVLENLQISDMKDVKNGGILIGCSTDDDSLTLKKITAEKLADKYGIKDVSSFNPRVRRNKDVISDNLHCKVMGIEIIEKRYDIFQAVLQLDYDTYSKIMSVSKGKLFEGSDVCKVYDYVAVKRRFNCNGFSHHSNQCKNQLHSTRCGDGQLLKDCKATSLKCVNCAKNSVDKNDVSPAAWDSNCSCYLKRVDGFKARLFFF
nr:unnamed protein product [Callosobruchus chinensis]